MTTPRTLLSMAGADLTPNSLTDSALILIDCQNEYLSGALPLDGVDAALDQISILLERARALETPIIHIVHKGTAGGLFDLDAQNGQIATKVAAREGEAVVEKTLPNSFAGSVLKQKIDETGRNKLIVAGFMTHMCVSATVRAALDLGYQSTVVAAAAATRDLPGIDGGVVTAKDLHQVTLTALSDRFAVIAIDADGIAD